MEKKKILFVFYLLGFIIGIVIQQPTAARTPLGEWSIPVSVHSASSPKWFAVGSSAAARTTSGPRMLCVISPVLASIRCTCGSRRIELDGAVGIRSFVSVRELFALIEEFLEPLCVWFFTRGHVIRFVLGVLIFGKKTTLCYCGRNREFGLQTFEKKKINLFEFIDW